MAAILNSAILNSDTAILDSDTLFLLSDSLKNTPTWFWLWLKLIQSDSNSFILTQLDDGSHLEFCHLEFGHLGFSHLSFSLKLTHTCQDWFPPFAQKKLHSFILTQLDDGSHLEFCHLGFSHFAWKKTSLSFISDSTWWWQPSWILPSWIQPSWIQPS